jgi:hypothetical protein
MHSPDKNAQDQVVPKEIKSMKRRNRESNLVLHPPGEPNSILRRPLFRGFPVNVLMMSNYVKFGNNIRYQIKLSPCRPKHDEVEPMSKVPVDNAYQIVSPSIKRNYRYTNVQTTTKMAKLTFLVFSHRI